MSSQISAGQQATFQLGSGTATGRPSLVYAKFVSGTGVGNGADTTNDALWTLTPIPANTFTANGDSLVLTLVFAAAATANNKAIGLTIGGTQVTSNVLAANGGDSVVTAVIQRVDATHVNIAFNGAIVANYWHALSANVVVADFTANTLAVVVTGASPTTGAAGDVKLYSGVAEFKK